MLRTSLRYILIILVSFSFPICAQNFDTMANLPFQNFEIAKQLIKTNTPDPKLTEQDMERAAIRGLLTVLNDPYSRYMTPEQVFSFKSRQGGTSDKKILKSVTKTMTINGVGYIKLETFEPATTTTEVSNAVQELDKGHIKCLILDLRNNGGGQFEQALGVLGLFIQNADVAYSMFRNGDKNPHKVGNTVIYPGPILVLINKNSASSSEVVAGAIQDLGRGQILGERSFGKASMQKLFEFPDGSGILLTVASYLTPKNKLIAKVGITPDILILPTPKGAGDKVLEEAFRIGMIEGYRRKF